MAVTGGKGRYERRRSARGQAHRPRLNRYYSGELKGIVPGDFTFRLTLLAPLSRTRLDALVESFDWADEEAVMTGSVQLRRPKPGFQVKRGDRVRCEVRWGSGWYELWTMRCGFPVVDPIEGTIDVELSDDMEALTSTKRQWTFRKTKRRKRGYFAHEIAQEVARRERIRLGQVARGTKRIDKLVMEASALRILKEAYGREREESGRRFVIRRRNGLLEIVPYRRNRVLYVIREEIENALLSQTGKARPATVIEARGRIGKGDDAKKVKTIVADRTAAARLGRVTTEVDYGRVSSRRQLIAKAQRDLAKRLRTKHEAELTIPGVPFIRRGDGCQWVTTERYWHGPSESSRDRSFVFVRSISHAVSSGGEYSTTLRIVQEDPFVKDRERRDKEMREKKERARK